MIGAYQCGKDGHQILGIKSIMKKVLRQVSYGTNWKLSVIHLRWMGAMNNISLIFWKKKNVRASPQGPIVLRRDWY